MNSETALTRKLTAPGSLLPLLGLSRHLIRSPAREYRRFGRVVPVAARALGVVPRKPERRYYSRQFRGAIRELSAKEACHVDARALGALSDRGDHSRHPRSGRHRYSADRDARGGNPVWLAVSHQRNRRPDHHLLDAPGAGFLVVARLGDPRNCGRCRAAVVADRKSVV